MTQKEIKINGKQYAFAFNFATICKVEEITGKPFDAETLSKMQTHTSFLQLVWSAIAANNDIHTDFNTFVRELTNEEFNICSRELAQGIQKFFAAHLPAAQDADDGERQDP